MVDIAPFNAAQSQTVNEIQRTERLAQSTYSALSTGRRVSDVTDAPQDFFVAKALTDRISDLSGQKATIDQDITSYNAALTGLSAIEDIASQLQGVTLSARGADDETRQALSEQYDRLASQITQIAGDTTYLGRSLIDSSDISASVGTASDYNNFASYDDTTNALSAVQTGLETARSVQSDFSTDIASQQITSDFYEELGNVLQSGVDNLVNADLNEEAANALSLQLRNSLSTESLQILAQSQSQLVGLVSGGS